MKFFMFCFILFFFPLFCSFHTVQLMQSGLSPEEAARAALKPIIKKYPDFNGAIVAASVSGQYGKNYIPCIESSKIFSGS